jgi:hypothetical protein
VEQHSSRNNNHTSDLPQRIFETINSAMDVSRKGDADLQDILAQASKDEEARNRLLKRKKHELKLVRKFDKSKLDRDECWFMIDANWLNTWSEFVNDPDGSDPPGVLSTKDLLCDPPVKTDSALSTSTGLVGRIKVPLPGLQARIDYRAVPPLVYFLLIELYGRDSSPDICRYSVDIYKPEVPIDRLVNIKLKAVVRNNSQLTNYVTTY